MNLLYDRINSAMQFCIIRFYNVHISREVDKKRGSLRSASVSFNRYVHLTSTEVPLESPHVPSRVANFCCYRRSCRRICSSCRRGPARRRSSFKGSKEWRIKCTWVRAPLASFLNFASANTSRRAAPWKLRGDMALITSTLRGRGGREGAGTDLSLMAEGIIWKHKGHKGRLTAVNKAR